MTAYREHLKAAIEATLFYSPTTYSWFKKRSQSFPMSVRRALTPETARSYLRYALQTQLYNDFYCPGLAQPAQYREAAAPVSGRTPFVESLADANSGSGYWTKDWKIRDIEGDDVFVEKQGLSLWAHPDNYRASPDTPLALGGSVGLRNPKESIAFSPGFYLAHGNDELAQEEEQPVIRWYWNLSTNDAVRFMRRCTELLNQSHVPFKLKILNEPKLFTRCDAVVLYTRKADFSTVSQLLAEVYAEVAIDINSNTPMFTKRLAPGVGLAEDLGQGESFGLHRCGLVAEGMISAHEQGKKSIEDRLEVVENIFAKEKIRPDQPFLNPDSCDDYNVCLVVPEQKQRVSVSGNSKHRRDAESFAHTALSIGDQLAHHAVWHHGRCNWLGAEPEGHLLGGATQMAFKALGPELYAGTSGVAIFLAELYATTGNTTARKTAAGAIRQAISTLDAVPVSLRLGLYTGWSGIAYAAARVGTLLKEEELLDGAKQVLQRLAQENPKEYEHDLLSGLAGAISSLIVLHDVFHSEPLLDLAVQLGDTLLGTADRSEFGYSWRAPNFPDQPNLTGFSHGAAGIAYSLTELFAATGDRSYLQAAEQAFAFERSLFDQSARNWPDLRTEPGQQNNPQTPPIFATAWCHGAPGIALARLRAYELIQDEIYKVEALAALRTTHEVVERSLHSRTGNYSLCHGLAGNADVLLQGFHMLGEGSVKETTLPCAVASSGIRRFGDSGIEWPCGPGGEKPSLMVGLAGIGYFYLRLDNPALPSVLMLQRGSF